MSSSKKRAARQKGASLIEALVAVLVMAFGMMAVAGIQGRLRYSGDAAKQRAEATRIATDEMERLRGYVSLTREAETPEGTLAFDEIADAERFIDATSARYKLQRRVETLADGSLDIHLAISWEDRVRSFGDEDEEASRKPFSMNWRTAVTRSDPRLALVAYTAPEFGVGQRRSQDRHPAIPPAAKTLKDDRSAFKPVPGGSTALVFNNVSGMVTQLCTGVPGATPTADLTEGDLLSCSSYPLGAYLLSGHVVFSLGPLPDPGSANDPVLPLGVEIELSSAVHPSSPVCFTNSGTNALAGINATDYYCIVEPRSPDSDKELYWSGKSKLTGLKLVAGGQRVCRYSDDYNGNGKIDNVEHPSSYSKLAESLARQNFLVIAHSATCPAGQKIDIAAQVYRNTVTVPHQP